MLNLSRIRLITFDVTNTLLKFRTSPGKQYGEIGAIYGVLCDNNALAENFKIHWRKMNIAHPNFGLNSGLGWENWWKMIIHDTFTDGNYCDTKDDKLEAIAHDLIETYKTATCWQMCFGCQDFLEYLKAKGILLGIVSNFDPRLPTILRNMKIDHYFKFILSSYEAGHAKPSVAIFDKALELACVPNLTTSGAMHIGDSPTLDYFGAAKAGWKPVLVNDKQTKKLLEEYPDLKKEYIFRSLYDLHKHFADCDKEADS